MTVNIRQGKDRIELWSKTAANEALQMSIGKQLKQLLDIPDSNKIGFVVFVSGPATTSAAAAAAAAPSTAAADIAVRQHQHLSYLSIRDPPASRALSRARSGTLPGPQRS